MKPTMKMYLVWDLTNYGTGFEHLGLYNTKEHAEKAYKEEMLKRYGTTNKQDLFELWDNANTGSCDSWRIDEVEIND